MKKILVILLILAVGTGVFAQGTWTIGGNAEITTRVDFDRTESTDPVAGIMAGGYFLPYDYWGPTKGAVTVGYSLGNFGSSVSVDSTDGLLADATITGENFRFQYGGSLQNYFNFEPYDGFTSTSTDGNKHFGRLWGEYKLLNGMVTLEAAYNSRDTEYWVSDKTGNFKGSPGDYVHHNFSNGDTFTKVDHHNYLLGNVSIAGLEIGMFLPNVFQSETWTDDRDNRDLLSEIGVTGDDGKTQIQLIEGVLKKAVVGAKFTMSPIEVAMQFKMEQYGVYLGGKFVTGPVTVGLSFNGQLDSDTHIKAGLNADYNAGAFGANLAGKFELDETVGGGVASRTTISVEPGFFYNAIPTHLQFKLNAGFYFITDKIGTTKSPMEVVWGVQPQIFWNFLGTGAAGDYWGLNTGMIVRYRIFKEATNALDLVFKFAL